MSGCFNELTDFFNKKYEGHLHGINSFLQNSCELEQIDLVKKESIIFKEETVSVTVVDDAELVLFLTDETAEVFKGGMYSGNQFAN